MKTREEILLKKIPNGTINLHSYKEEKKLICEAMQEHSDQQTANLRAVNAKQVELIGKLKEWLKEVKIFDCNCGSCSRFRSEIAALEKEPTAMEMIKEVFEPIQLGENEIVNQALELASKKAGKETKEVKCTCGNPSGEGLCNFEDDEKLIYNCADCGRPVHD